jgi:hypothetical protein
MTYNYNKVQIFEGPVPPHVYKRNGFFIYSDFELSPRFLQSCPEHVGTLLRPFLTRYEHIIHSRQWCGMTEMQLYKRVELGDIFAFGIHVEKRGQLHINCITVVENERNNIDNKYYFKHTKRKTNSGPLNIIRQVIVYFRRVHLICDGCSQLNTLYTIGSNLSKSYCDVCHDHVILQMNQLLFGEMLITLQELIPTRKCVICRDYKKIHGILPDCKHKGLKKPSINFQKLRQTL